MTKMTGLDAVPFGTPFELKLRFSDVDSMRVVHHAVYLQFFETMRFAVMKDLLGISIGRFLSENVVCPVVDCQVKYLRALTLSHNPVGYTRFWMLRNSSFAFDYWITDQPGSRDIYTRGRTRHCFATPELELLLRAPAFFSEAFHNAARNHPESLCESNELEQIL